MFDYQGKRVSNLISAEEIAARTAVLGEQITRDHEQVGEDLVCVCVLKGSVLFFTDLIRKIRLPLVVDFIGIQSYGDETKSSGVVKITQDLSRPVEGKHVLLIEDIVDTGLTMSYLRQNLATRNPASVKLATLLHKPARTVVPQQIDYLGFEIPDKFVIGYGLDFAQRYRNLPFIGVVE